VADRSNRASSVKKGAKDLYLSKSRYVPGKCLLFWKFYSIPNFQVLPKQTLQTTIKMERHQMGTQTLDLVNPNKILRRKLDLHCKQDSNTLMVRFSGTNLGFGV
jgi:hypothetical protein